MHVSKSKAVSILFCQNMLERHGFVLNPSFVTKSDMIKKNCNKVLCYFCPIKKL